MKVFISWSGPETREFATFLRDWLQGVIQAVKPWMSEKDIAKGRHSMAELRAQLADTRLGIVVLTAANQGSQWVNFEAGAISNSVGEGSVIPLLLDLGKTDVVGPLSQFQAVDAADRTEVHQMLDAINRAQHEPLPERVLAHASEREWAGFEAEVRRFRSATRAMAEVVPARDEREVLAEILETVRALDRENHATRSLVAGLAATLSQNQQKQLRVEGGYAPSDPLAPAAPQSAYPGYEAPQSAAQSAAQSGYGYPEPSSPYAAQALFHPEAPFAHRQEPQRREPPARRQGWGPAPSPSAPPSPAPAPPAEGSGAEQP